MEYTLYFDGSTEPVNPGGVCGFGWVLFRGDERIDEGSGLAAPLGDVRATNNIAEYTGILKGIDGSRRWLTAGDDLLIRGDSKLVVEQVFGRWRINAPHLLQPAQSVRQKLDTLARARIRVGLVWVSREQNAPADDLSKATVVGIIRDKPEDVLNIPMPWGIHVGRRLKDLPDGYYDWIWNRVPELRIDRREVARERRQRRHEERLCPPTTSESAS